MALLPSDQDYPDGWIDDLTKTFVARRPMFPEGFYKPICRLGEDPNQDLSFVEDSNPVYTYEPLHKPTESIGPIDGDIDGGSDEIGTEFGLKPVDGDIKPSDGDIKPERGDIEASTSFFGDGSAIGEGSTFGDDAGFGVIGDAGSVLIDGDGGSAGEKQWIGDPGSGGIGPEEWEKQMIGGDHGIGGSDQIKDYIVGGTREGLGRNDEGIGGSQEIEDSIIIGGMHDIQVKKTSEIVIDDSILIGGSNGMIWPENDDG